MFWSYGGGWAFGTGAMYPGFDLALNANVVVVNFNYRVGSIGFMSTG